MEAEEHEIRSVMFEKNIKLIFKPADSQEGNEEQVRPALTIDVDKFNALNKEFKRVVKDQVSKEVAEQMEDLRENVKTCLNIIEMCPNKELLESAKESVAEICPHVVFEQ